jgi:hypothetical protein
VLTRLPWQIGLKWLLIVNVVGSALHYADNLLFFDEYPEPWWINRSIIDAFWFVMTPLAWIGYRLIQRGRLFPGHLILLGYAGCNLLALGHYRYASFCSISPRIHIFILLEALLAVVLIAYLSIPLLRKKNIQQN